MFFRLFGEFLLDRNIITEVELDELIEYRRNNRVRLGELALSLGYLTVKQTNEINLYQSRVDRRFGDIAIERGYLTEKEVSKIMDMQDEPYHLFSQGIKELNIMDQKDFEQYVSEYAENKGLSDEDMIHIKNGDLDLIAPSIIKTGNAPSEEVFLLLLRNIQRFISNDIYFAPPVKKTDYRVNHISFQEITGPFPMIIGLCCDNSELLTLASIYAKEDFTELDADSYDAVCEFINIVDGLFARKRSAEGIEMNLLPPTYCDSLMVTSDRDFYTMPVKINNAPITMFVAVKNSNIKFSKI